MTTINLYESPALHALTGPVLRPGGFELTERGLACCKLSKDARVLDVGCGTGASVDYLQKHYGFKAVGIDLSVALLGKGKQTYGSAPLILGRAEQLPMATGCLEMVLCECVLSLCSDPLNVLKEMRRVLLPQGSLVLMDIYAQTPKSKGWALRGLNVRCCLQGAVDRTAVENRVAAAGFELLLWEDHTRLLKQLAAQLVWTYGSLDAFWSAVAGPDTAETLCRRGGAGGSARPGYYLLVARKPKNK